MLLIGEGIPADYDRAYANLDAAAKAGDRRGMYALGVFYESGFAKPADIEAALDWYEKSAELGLADAQVALGQIYYAGEVVERDLGKAVRWLHRAAKQGNGFGQLGIGIMLLQGEGVALDRRAAYVWFGLAKARLQPGEALGLAAEGMGDAARELGVEDRQSADTKIAAWTPQLEWGDALPFPQP